MIEKYFAPKKANVGMFGGKTPLFWVKNKNVCKEERGEGVFSPGVVVLFNIITIGRKDV